jgi:hypothetical protein
MFEKITSTPRKVKDHVVKHRAKYAVAATAAVALKLQFRTANQFNTFLEEKGLLEEYYHLDEI